MSKKNRYTEADLKAIGLTEVSPGVYQRGLGTVKKPYEARFDTPKQKINNSPAFELAKPGESYITIEGIVAGLNGDKGLMRSHWSGVKKQKELYQTIIREHLRTGKARKHSGPVIITYIGYKSSLMDWDNYCASFKHIGDALAKEGIIVDDNPRIVENFYPRQIKSKRAEQKVIIIIEDIHVQAS